MIVIGVDPGLKGAIAAIDGDRVAYRLLIDCYDPEGARVVPALFLDAVASVAAELGGEAVAIGVERQQAMKRQGRTQGVASTFKTAINYGLILGACEGAGLSPYDLHPKVWRRLAGITVAKGADPKVATIRRVKSLFPLVNLRPGEGRRKKRTDHDGIADAIGIALGARSRWAASKGGSNG
jgi:hypothetical protein